MFSPGQESMGLLWSLQAEETMKKKGMRLRKKDVTQPHNVVFSVLPDHVAANSLAFHQGTNVLAQATVQRFYMSPDVHRIPVREGRLRGTLFVPKGKHQGAMAAPTLV